MDANTLLREYLPLKQGLRLIRIHSSAIYRPQRVSSIKTRIKTNEIKHFALFLMKLREYLPLKQGLRRIREPACTQQRHLTQRVSSIKTRIKTLLLLAICRIRALREYLPLKQGLRLTILHSGADNKNLREYLPLKQGLRPLLLFTRCSEQCYSESIFH